MLSPNSQGHLVPQGAPGSSGSCRPGAKFVNSAGLRMILDPTLLCYCDLSTDTPDVLNFPIHQPA